MEAPADVADALAGDALPPAAELPHAPAGTQPPVSRRRGREEWAAAEYVKNDAFKNEQFMAGTTDEGEVMITVRDGDGFTLGKSFFFDVRQDARADPGQQRQQSSRDLCLLLRLRLLVLHPPRGSTGRPPHPPTPQPRAGWRRRPGAPPHTGRG